VGFVLFQGGYMQVKTLSMGLIASMCLLAMSLAGCNKMGTMELKVGNHLITSDGTEQIKIAVEQFNQAKFDEVEKLSRVFAEQCRGVVSVDSAKYSIINGVQVPTMKINGRSIHEDHTLPDTLTKDTEGVATLFVRSGDEFIRVSTSLKREDGGRMFGTTLDHRHPAYSAALAGNGYTGYADLFDNTYMTDYVPIKDDAGRVIGVRFVGVNITGDIYAMQAKFRRMA
jgi:methyl-accepting chemotaxis protein